MKYRFDTQRQLLRIMSVCNKENDFELFIKESEMYMISKADY